MLPLPSLLPYWGVGESLVALARVPFAQGYPLETLWSAPHSQLIIPKMV